jgi:hypothetical protein
MDLVLASCGTICTSSVSHTPHRSSQHQHARGPFVPLRIPPTQGIVPSDPIAFIAGRTVQPTVLPTPTALFQCVLLPHVSTPPDASVARTGGYASPVMQICPLSISASSSAFCPAGPADATLVLPAPVSHAPHRRRWMCQFVWTEVAATAAGATRRAPDSAYGYTYGTAASRTRPVSIALNSVRTVLATACSIANLRAMSHCPRRL